MIRRPGVVFDIDGVLLKGGAVINGAKRAVAKLAEARIPFIFVTNGGGMLESTKAADLTTKLGRKLASAHVNLVPLARPLRSFLQSGII